VDDIEAGLLRAILAEPRSDEPRLALADHLDETAGKAACRECAGQGAIYLVQNPGCDTEHLTEETCPVCRGSRLDCGGRAGQAAFIRTQIELARLEAGADEPVADTPEEVDAAWAERYRYMDELREAARKMLSPQPDWARLPGDGWGWTIDRGQIANVTESAHCQPLAVWRRGFVEEVRLTPARFLGLRCQICRGVGASLGFQLPSPIVVEEVGCCGCEGFGYVGSRGILVMRVQPVERVVLAGLEPADRTEVNGEYYWFRGGMPRNPVGVEEDDVPAATVPEEIFDVLADYRADVFGLPYNSRPRALYALSKACIRWALARGRMTQTGRAE
jgi:uncharacterized protein (TIGR02996 family)